MTDPRPPQPHDAETAATQARVVDAWLRCAASRVHERRLWLTELDAAIGDGDHGINLDRGLMAVLADLDAADGPGDDVGALLTAAGRRLLGVVGGASGALYGRALMTAGERMRVSAGEATPGARGLALVVLDGAVSGIAALGRAVPGEKTMLDTLVPALEALRGAPTDLPLDSVMLGVAEAAEAGAVATIPLVARKGRASYLGERSAGHLDPGAASSAILVRCLADAVATAQRDLGENGVDGPAPGAPGGPGDELAPQRL